MGGRSVVTGPCCSVASERSQLPATVTGVNAVRPSQTTGPGRWRGEGGFTMSELVLVAVFVVGLIVVAITSARGIEAENRKSNCQTELRNLKIAVAEYHAERASYPTSVAEVVSAGKAEMGDVESWRIEAGGGQERPEYRPVGGTC